MLKANEKSVGLAQWPPNPHAPLRCGVCSGRCYATGSGDGVVAFSATHVTLTSGFDFS